MKILTAREELVKAKPQKRRRPTDLAGIAAKGLTAGGLATICLALAVGISFSIFGATVVYPVALPFVVAGLGATTWITGGLWRASRKVRHRYVDLARSILRAALVIAAVSLALGVLLLLFTWGLIVPANPVALMGISIPIMAVSLIAIAIMWGITADDYS